MLLYATRSLLPGHTANALQSAHMACALDHLHPEGFTTVYRSPVPSADPVSHFAAIGLTPPFRTRAIGCLPSPFGWSQLDLLAFRAFFLAQPRDAVVYTRSSRVSWAAVSAGLITFIELHDPLTPFSTAWLRHLQHTGHLPGIIVTTARLKTDLMAALPDFDADRILVAGNAGPASALTLPARPLRSRVEFNVGYAGSAFCGKGVEVLLACAARMPDVAFHVIGPDEALCSKRGALTANIVFHGHKTNPETIGLLKSMDALLLPNQRSVIIRSGADIGAHTSPLKLFEYLATGRPIVASDLPVFQGILRHQENALLASPEDVDGFCRQLRRVQHEPALGQRLGERARLEFAAGHTWEHRAERILNFITPLMPLAA
jgi:glycosyltransferase involved in cell wall biosynthesis